MVNFTHAHTHTLTHTHTHIHTHTRFVFTSSTCNLSEAAMCSNQNGVRGQKHSSEEIHIRRTRGLGWAAVLCAPAERGEPFPVTKQARHQQQRGSLNNHGLCWSSLAAQRQHSRAYTTHEWLTATVVVVVVICQYQVKNGGKRKRNHITHTNENIGKQMCATFSTIKKKRYKTPSEESQLSS